ncbi:UPF0158 family protein [Neobacillus sp. SM06]|uniref:UPF0158 family protein n=1 Tax=Neobacillus sp. SM06 TaxID=3422492 RepID=UPI003D284E13
MNLLDELIDIFLTNERDTAFYDLKTKGIVNDWNEAETGEPGIDWDEVGSEERYLGIPTIESFEAFQLMEKFAVSVEDDRKSDKLFAALDRPRPFRQFQDALFKLDMRDQWYDFEYQYGKKRIEEWLKEVEKE